MLTEPKWSKLKQDVCDSHWPEQAQPRKLHKHSLTMRAEQDTEGHSSPGLDKGENGGDDDSQADVCNPRVEELDTAMTAWAGVVLQQHVTMLLCPERPLLRMLIVS